MIKTFEDQPRPSYIPEASELASVVAADDYQRLLSAFKNMIIRGTSDNDTIPSELLMKFKSVLWYAEKEGDKTPEPLGEAMTSLQERLKKAVKQAESQTKYELILALSSVLDTMNEVKTAGLDRKTLHEPLRKELHTLREGEEPRLTQAASYAYQALLGIRDSEGPYELLWRHVKDIATPAAKVAGAVTTVDPAKLFEGLEQLQDLKTLVTTLVDISKALSDTSALNSWEHLSKQREWYRALRYADMLIRAKAFQHLESFVDTCTQFSDEKP